MMGVLESKNVHVVAKLERYGFGEYLKVNTTSGRQPVPAILSTIRSCSDV